jgi:hypothetical protein
MRFAAFLLLQQAVLSLQCGTVFAQSSSPLSKNVLYFPQLIAGGDYTSYITLPNVNNTARAT